MVSSVWQDRTERVLGAGTSTSPVPIVKSAAITLSVSEDAQYTVKVDAHQVDGVRTATMLHSSGDSDVVS